MNLQQVCQRRKVQSLYKEVPSISKRTSMQFWKGTFRTWFGWALNFKNTVLMELLDSRCSVSEELFEITRSHNALKYIKQHDRMMHLCTWKFTFQPINSLRPSIYQADGAVAWRDEYVLFSDNLFANSIFQTHSELVYIKTQYLLKWRTAASTLR